jgi:hypothetical protein
MVHVFYWIRQPYSVYIYHSGELVVFHSVRGIFVGVVLLDHGVSYGKVGFALSIFSFCLYA